MNATWVTNESIKLWTETFGDPKHPAILLIIGAGAVSSFFPDTFCQNLSQHGFFVIRYDQRDYGKSTHFPQVSAQMFKEPAELKAHLPYQINDLLDDAVAILDNYRIKKAHVVGHSMGGTIAQVLSVTSPERVRSVISMSVGPASPFAKIEPIPEKTLEVLYANQPEGNLEKDKAGWMDSFRLLNGDVPFDEEMTTAYLKTLYARNQKPGVAWNHIGIQHFPPDHDKAFKSLMIPTLILHGEKDPIQPVSYAQAVQDLIPRAQVKILPHVGHMFFNTQTWASLGDIFLDFFEKNHS